MLTLFSNGLTENSAVIERDCEMRSRSSKLATTWSEWAIAVNRTRHEGYVTWRGTTSTSHTRNNYQQH